MVATKGRGIGRWRVAIAIVLALAAAAYGYGLFSVDQQSSSCNASAYATWQRTLDSNPYPAGSSQNQNWTTSANDAYDHGLTSCLNALEAGQHELFAAFWGSYACAMGWFFFHQYRTRDRSTAKRGPGEAPHANLVRPLINPPTFRPPVPPPRG